MPRWLAALGLPGLVDVHTQLPAGAGDDEGVEVLRARPLPGAHTALNVFGEVPAELDWVRSLVEALDTGELTWSEEWVRRYTVPASGAG